MQTNLEFLINLLGKTEAESILQAYVKKAWNGTASEVNPKPLRKQRKKMVLGAKRWTSEEDTRIMARAKELYAVNRNKTKISKILAPEFHRTPSAIYNRLFVVRLDEFNEIQTERTQAFKIKEIN